MFILPMFSGDYWIEIRYSHTYCMGTSLYHISVIRTKFDDTKVSQTEELRNLGVSQTEGRRPNRTRHARIQFPRGRFG